MKAYDDETINKYFGCVIYVRIENKITKQFYSADTGLRPYYIIQIYKYLNIETVDIFNKTTIGF